MKHAITLLTALLMIPLSELHGADISGRLACCSVVRACPTPRAEAGRSQTMSRCLLLGTGNLMVSPAGGLETLTLFLDKPGCLRILGCADNYLKPEDAS
jgi:hypothetical protein